MNPGPRNATVTALSDLDVLIIGPRRVRRHGGHPRFRDALLKSMAYRLHTADARLAAAMDELEAPSHISPS